MDSKISLFLSVLVCLDVCLFARGAPAKPSVDPPANWRDLIGADALNNQHGLVAGENLFEGDIKGVDRNIATTNIVGLEQAHNAVMERAQLWPNGIVPYTIGSGYNAQQKQVIEGALKDIMQKTCVKFVPRKSERDYITFVNRNSGCSSYVARVGGQQLIDLQEGCIYEFGEVQHETMHALGFFHEQSRKDRDDFVTIVWNNIQKDNYDQFEKYQSNMLGLAYDYDSIMHYGWNYFAMDRKKPTIVPKQKASIGNRKAMSPTDVQKINLLYQCSGAKAPAPSSGGSSGGSSRPATSRPSSSGSGSASRSILDILFGRGDNAERQPSNSRPAADDSSGGIKGAIKSFVFGLFG